MTRRDLETTTSFEELVEMHDLLDTLESAEAMSRVSKTPRGTVPDAP